MNSAPISTVAWTWPRKALWAVALLATCVIYAPSYRNALATHTRVGDFFQEWASARNHWEGLPIYTPQVLTAWRYLQYRPNYEQGVFVGMNGHPPACVLLALPLGKLDYSDAFLLWDGLSIGGLLLCSILALKFETGTLRTWYWLPLLTLALSNPFVQHLLMGQLSIFLTLLLLGMVWADDRDRPIVAGLLLGLATALKLFPGLFLLYFATQRKWRTVFVASLTFLGINVVGAAVLGLQAYEHFYRLAMPEVLRYRDFWTNYSLTGWWFKLLDGSSGQTIPMWTNGTAARVGAFASVALVMGVTAWTARRAGERREARRTSLALFFPMVILAAPVAWDHYFLLLLWPGLHLALRTPVGSAGCWVLRIAAFFLWLNPMVLHSLATKPLQPTPAWASLLLVSLPAYALGAFYLLNLRLAWLEATVPEVAGVADASAAEATAVQAV